MHVGGPDQGAECGADEPVVVVAAVAVVVVVVAVAMVVVAVVVAVACPTASDPVDRYVGSAGAPELHGCKTPSLQEQRFMKRDDFSIYDASEQDIERLDDWYILAGGRPGDAKDRANLLRAKESGVLGRAIGNTLRENTERLLTTPFEDWFYARTAIKALRVKDETVGVMVVGAHRMLWEQLTKYSGETLDMNDLDSWPEWAAAFTGTALRTAKLHLVAVSPDLQGRGYGSRLVKRALKISERGSAVMLLGDQHFHVVLGDGLHFYVAVAVNNRSQRCRIGITRRRFYPYRLGCEPRINCLLHRHIGRRSMRTSSEFRRCLGVPLSSGLHRLEPLPVLQPPAV